MKLRKIRPEGRERMRLRAKTTAHVVRELRFRRWRAEILEQELTWVRLAEGTGLDPKTVKQICTSRRTWKHVYPTQEQYRELGKLEGHFGLEEFFKARKRAYEEERWEE